MAEFALDTCLYELAGPGGSLLRGSFLYSISLYSILPQYSGIMEQTDLVLRLPYASGLPAKSFPGTVDLLLVHNLGNPFPLRTRKVLWWENLRKSPECGSDAGDLFVGGRLAYCNSLVTPTTLVSWLRDLQTIMQSNKAASTKNEAPTVSHIPQAEADLIIT